MDCLVAISRALITASKMDFLKGLVEHIPLHLSYHLSEPEEARREWFASYTHLQEQEESQMLTPEK